MGRKKALLGGGIAALALAALVAAAGWAFYGESGHVYAVVDNDRIEAIEPRAGMSFEYTLDAYSENGTKEPLTFQTSRELREGAILDLETKPLRGVVGWAETTLDRLPEAVRDALDDA